MRNLSNDIDINAIPGERWFPEETHIVDDLEKYWGGDFGVASETGKLKAVLMRRPGPEIDNFDPNEVRFRATIDPELFRKQFDEIANLY